MRRELHAEWTKLRTEPGTAWLLLAAVALTVAVSAAVSAVVTCAPARCDHDTARLALSGVQVGQAGFVILAVLVISGEHSTGMMRTTLTAMPRRVTVLAAKATILTCLALAAGTVTACVAPSLAGISRRSFANPKSSTFA